SISRRFTSHGVAYRSPHVLSLVNQEAVTDQRCPSARSSSTATKPAIAAQDRRMVNLAPVPTPHAGQTKNSHHARVTAAKTRRVTWANKRAKLPHTARP